MRVWARSFVLRVIFIEERGIPLAHAYRRLLSVWLAADYCIGSYYAAQVRTLEELFQKLKGPDASSRSRRPSGALVVRYCKLVYCIIMLEVTQCMGVSMTQTGNL